jgi:hypothetical protein
MTARQEPTISAPFRVQMLVLLGPGGLVVAQRKKLEVLHRALCNQVSLEERAALARTLFLAVLVVVLLLGSLAPELVKLEEALLLAAALVVADRMVLALQLAQTHLPLTDQMAEME